MSNETSVVPTAAGTIARQEFGAQQIQVQAETASSALAAQAQALVEARFIMAMRRPRDMDDVRQKLLRACERPGFAGSTDPKEKIYGAAWYRKPVGEGVEGFSVRFAEEALRALGNVDIQTIVTWDDPQRRLITVVVLDLESNIGYPTSIVIEKTVERKFLKKGQIAIRSRVNSYGEMVHLVEATDDEVFAKQNSLASKTIRNAVLRILPGDIQAACRTRILEIRNGDIAKDPDKARRSIADAFAALNVLPSGLKQYLGHDLGTATPAEIAELRDVYSAIQAGDATWVELLSEKTGRSEETPAEGEKKTGTESVKEKLKAQAAAAAASTTTQAPTTAKAAETKPEPAQEREPGSDDDIVEDVKKFVEATAPVTAASCKHEGLVVPAGKTVACEHCTLPIEGPWPAPAKRQSKLAGL